MARAEDMRAIVMKELSISEMEGLIVRVWIAVEACGIRSPTISAVPQSATWTIRFQFDSDEDIDRVTGKLPDVPRSDWRRDAEQSTVGGGLASDAK